MDAHLDSTLARLQAIAKQLGDYDGDHPSLTQVAQSPPNTYGQNLFWLDTQGHILWTAPANPTMLLQPFTDFSVIRPVLETGDSYVSNLFHPENSSLPYILLTVPVFDSTGEANGLLAEKTSIEQLGLPEILNHAALNSTVYVEIVDHNGTILASNIVGHAFKPGDQDGQFTGLINKHQPVIGECHQCHSVNGEERITRIDEVLAFVPLESAPWGVAVRQPAEEVLAPANQLRQQLLLGGGVLLAAVVLVTSWFVRRQIADPIQALDKASVQLAAGNLGVPIRKRGIDEVARLTANLERMRVRLEATLEDQRRWNETLEEMVEERTRELTGLYEQLEGKAVMCKQLLGKVLTAQEEERTRLARELHDTIGQSLTAIIMTTASVEKNLPPDLPGGRRRLGRVRSIAAHALKDLRGVISDLRPESLDDLGLVLALRAQIKEHLEPVGIEVQLKVTDLQHRLPSEVEIVIFRVLQEAITNIARHARANEVRISLNKKIGGLIVRVEDDGIGFDPDEVMNGQQQAWGLRGMEERIALLGGKFYIGSKPGAGTLLMAEVPLEQHNKVKFKGSSNE
jgi:signal transduction histidine kinase